MELTPNALKVLEKRYLRRDLDNRVVETPKEMFIRVARAIAEADLHYGKTKEEVEETFLEFYTIMANLEFLPNSPTLMNAGTEMGQLSACFVLPVEDSIEGIFNAIKHAAIIHKTGGGTGFSFSRLRPKGDVVKTTMGVASGPVSFMMVYDAATEAIKQGGKRRGANMGILDVHHPDILEFITCKRDNQKLSNFNISVAVDDAFMEAVEKGEEFDLINPRNGQKVGKLNAREVFDLIAETAWATGDPGLVFLDEINRHNPTPHVGRIEATNPCGEQPLLPYESCNLGSINLSKMVKDGRIDWDRLREVTRIAVHFLDNVIDVNKYPLPEIERMTKANRKIGLGVMGFADMLIKLRIPYDSRKALEVAEAVMRFIQEESKVASEILAEERGVFPNYEGSIWDGVRKLRNATTTTIAPTGTISIIAGCSSGIEPLFAICYVRNVLEGQRLIEVNSLFEEEAKRRGFYSEALMEKIAQKGSLRDIDEIPEDVKRVFVTAHDVSVEWHVRMQAAFQKYTDNAVSKTINLPNSATVEDVKRAFMLAWKLKCKGITVYRDGCKETQVLETGETRRIRQWIKPRKRPKKTYGVTVEMPTGCGSLYITINEDENGMPFEVFARLGKAGGCASAQTEGLGRAVSLMLRCGVDPEHIVRQFKGISCDRHYGVGVNKILSCPDAIGKALEEYLREKGLLKSENLEASKSEGKKVLLGNGACPWCGSPLIMMEGCKRCLAGCGYSECS
ncbi:MAG: ribonucleotide-diphosphate reductase subunit alpha [Candidatus Hecatellales archaeon]|nr:MAG: ribonucleotide-diphosphate reductase subunit alpha [Candidatus Hecatellales archaeon]